MNSASHRLTVPFLGSESRMGVRLTGAKVKTAESNTVQTRQGVWGPRPATTAYSDATLSPQPHFLTCKTQIKKSSLSLCSLSGYFQRKT